MTLELIAFIIAILLGIILYWKESQGNALYLFFNKLMNSKELQMQPTDKKGFVYQQLFLLRLVFITSFFVLAIVLIKFLVPLNLATISLFASMIFGTLIGTYIAGFIFKSSEIIEEQTENLEEKFDEVIEKGKDFIDNLQYKEEKIENLQQAPKAEEKSARDRLKDKGFLK